MLVDIARLAEPGKRDVKRHSPSILYLSTRKKDIHRGRMTLTYEVYNCFVIWL